MSPLPSSPPLADVLRSHGLRLTAPRQLVLEAVHTLGHATPDQVHASVSERAAGVNITTVYRTLELLENLGLITHTHLTHGAPTYHPAGVDEHVHLVCHDCGTVEELAPAILSAIADTLARDRGFRLDIGHAALFGTCAGCSTIGVQTAGARASS